MGVIGGISGGALGFIAGNVGGALVGAEIGSALEDRKNVRKRLRESQANRPLKKVKADSGNKEATRRRISSQMAAKRAVRRSRSRKTVRVKKVKRPSAKRTRKVKKAASKFVKGVVDRALKCELTTSVYRKYQTGEVVIPQSDDDVATGYQLMFSGNTQNGLATRGSPARNPACMMWTYFTPKKMLDAASVLFNGKARSADYLIATDNLAFASLKLEVVYQSVKWEALNNTFYRIKYELYEFHARGSTDTSAGHEIVNSSSAGINTASFAGAVTQGFADNSDRDGVARAFRYSCPLVNKLSDFKGYEGKWSHKLVKKGTWMPGTSLTHYMHQKPGCVDFKKYINPTNTLAYYAKGTTALILIIKSKLHMGTVPNVTGESRNAAHPGFAGANDDNGNGVVLAINESYTIREPEEATVNDSQILGFQDLAVKDGVVDSTIATRIEEFKYQ